MSTRKHVDPPYSIMAVLDEALQSFDGRFKQVPNGKIDIAWRQERKTKGDESPPRYFFGIEFIYVPSAAGSPSEPAQSTTYVPPVVFEDFASKPPSEPETGG